MARIHYELQHTCFFRDKTSLIVTTLSPCFIVFSTIGLLDPFSRGTCNDTLTLNLVGVLGVKSILGAMFITFDSRKVHLIIHTVTVFYLINKCPSTALDMKTLKEVWSGHSPNFDYLRTFDCVVYIHISQSKLNVLDVKFIFIWYREGVKGYCVWCLKPGFKRCIINRDIIFNETKIMYNSV